MTITAVGVATPEAVAASQGNHTVKRGETLAAIAATYKIKGGWKSLASWNRLKNANVIHVGQQLTLQAPTTKPSRTATKVLPAIMARTGGGTQLITVTGTSLKSTTATLTWWTKSGSTWKPDGSVQARLGAKGMANGATRKQGTFTTPTGLFGMPFAFGTRRPPKGTTLPYKKVTSSAWWCEDNRSVALNRWVDPLPKDCRASESEHLVNYPVQYAIAVVINFNYTRPVKNRGAGIFLHINGRGSTAGCVSVPASTMAKLTAWLKPSAKPHIAIGTTAGVTAITRY
ncbi:LysM peptidoglycan-binding domain-containing protein [Streptomyces sp. NBC_01465]|uniref:LysM peptidoglycan-binding domain-containing protein n=1 Tax=Streptomyces sp. NBC_01465 TaxID=2903878 RepID=UPI002E36CBB0|nr:LysM peptidoglycan-binding domain-containing protein [Streptomyces sp. NBC_01465]